MTRKTPSLLDSISDILPGVVCEVRDIEFSEALEIAAEPRKGILISTQKGEGILVGPVRNDTKMVGIECR